MKATIEVPDNLYKKVKAEAALRGLTVREVTTQLYRRWLAEDDHEKRQQSSSEWIRSWLAAAHEAIRDAPEGPTAREEIEADRNRMDPKYWVKPE